MSEIPSELRYTKEHEWIRIDGDIVIVDTRTMEYIKKV